MINKNKIILKSDIVLTSKVFILCFLSLMLIIVGIGMGSATLSITPNPSNPVNGSVINAKFVPLGYNITSDNPISSIVWNWNNTNYSYLNGLITWYAFDNVSLLDENQSKVADLSGNGNNATVYNMTWNSSYGRGSYGGGFSFGRNTSANTPKMIKYNQKITNASDWTVSIWVKPQVNSYMTGLSERTTLVKGLGNYNVWIYTKPLASSSYCSASGTNSTPSSDFEMLGTNMINSSQISFTNNCPYGRWSNLVLTNHFDGANNNLSFYVNGKLFANGIALGQLRGESTQGNIGGHESYPQFDYMALNGSIDDFMLWNRTLDSNEAKELYSVQISQVNKTFYLVTLNQTPTTYINNYYLSANDTLGNYQQTATNTIIFKLANIIRAASNILGIVNPNFFGVGLQSTKLMSGVIDTNCDGVYETNRNYTWQQETLLNSKGRITYYDVFFNNYYNGVENEGFEFWKNATLERVNNTSSNIERAWGWRMAGSIDANALISQSIDAHSGNYSLNITRDSGGLSDNFIIYPYFNGATTYIYRGFNETYMVNFWVKGNGTFAVGIQNATGTACNTTTFSINYTDNWKAVNTSCIIPTYGQYNFYINGISRNETLLVDDFSNYVNGTENKWWFTGNISGYESDVDFNINHGINVSIILDYMPRFLANRSSKCLIGDSDTDFSDCNAKDYSSWNSMSLDFYKRIDKGRNLIMLQIWNEPEGGAFQDQLATSSAKMDFVSLFNTTYNNFKGYNSNISINGYRAISAAITTTSLSAFTRMMLSNLSSQFDVFSYHPYESAGYINSDRVSDEIKYLQSQCALYGAKCSRIILDEWQPNYAARNASNANSDLYKAEIAFFITDLLNNLPANISEMPYHWDDQVSYFKCGNRYSEYPSFWSSVSEAGLDNPTPTYYPAYTVPKSFATWIPAQATVYNYSVSDYGVYPTFGKIGDTCSAILLNADTDTINISAVNMSGLGCNKLWMDTATGMIFNVSSDTFSYGELPVYGLAYLTTPNLTLTSAGLNKTNSFGEQIGALGTEVSITSDTTNSNGLRSIHIASSLPTHNETIKIENVNCGNIQSLSYTPKNANAYLPTYICTAEGLTLYDVVVNPSSESNILDIQMGLIGSTCNETTQTFYKIILDLSAIAILAVVLFFVFKDGWENVSLQKVLFAALAIIIGVILFQMSADNLALGDCVG